VRLLPTAAAALYRALKTKHETPKYGLIYHASLIGQSQPKFKGKISRVLAAKCALAIRVDALGDTTDAAVGTEARTKVWHGPEHMLDFFPPLLSRLAGWLQASCKLEFVGKHQSACCFVPDWQS
jgi:hypothetical protein